MWRMTYDVRRMTHGVILMAYGVSHEGLFCFFIEKNTEACLSWIFARFKKENIMKNFREMKILLNLINFLKFS